jgi:predicted acetyltransferase
LNLTLKKAKEIGLKNVLVTSDKSTVASTRVIEKNGGKLENEVISKESGEPVLRYWIDLLIQD